MANELLAKGIIGALETLPPGLLDRLNEVGGTVCICVCAVDADAAKMDLNGLTSAKHELPDVRTGHTMIGVTGEGRKPEQSTRFLGEVGTAEQKAALAAIAQGLICTLADEN